CQTTDCNEPDVTRGEPTTAHPRAHSTLRDNSCTDAFWPQKKARAIARASLYQRATSPSLRRRPKWHQAGPRLRQSTSSSRPPPRSEFPESRAEDSLGFTTVVPAGGRVNLSPGRGIALLVANRRLFRCRVGPRG